MSAAVVSIFLMTFNHERFVREAIESILTEGHPTDRLQLVVLDNGSTDATPRIVREYADRAEVHCIDPLPVNQAINLGLGLLSDDSDYFTVFSGDDVWCPGRLAHSIEIMARRPEVGLLCGDKEVIDGAGRTLAQSGARVIGVELPDGPSLGRLFETNAVFGPTMLIRGALKAALAPIPPQAAWEDWWFALTASRVSELAFTRARLAKYRRHGNNITEVSSPEKEAHLLREELRFRGWLLQTVAAGDASAEDLLYAAVKQYDFVARLAEIERRPPARVAGITQADRRRARASLRLAQGAGDPLERLIHLAHAVGHDPTEPRYGRALSRQAGIVHEASLDGVVGHVDPAQLIADARECVTLARADELIATPGLLADYARAVGPHDPATLAVHAPGDPAKSAQALEAAFAAAGVGEEDIPDVVILPLPDAPSVNAALAVRADDLLTRGKASGWPYEGMQRFAAAA